MKSNFGLGFYGSGDAIKPYNYQRKGCSYYRRRRRRTCKSYIFSQLDEEWTINLVRCY